ncbi:alpha/beta hydrolase family protein [Ferrimonas sp.]|uniref:alpha/beta hydrolase family protein n=1 Tax=Ferrimonas sp. TaxID=2080861 RepID=UPI003A911739
MKNLLLTFMALGWASLLLPFAANGAGSGDNEGEKEWKPVKERRREIAELFFKAPDATSPRVSPDGHLVVYKRYSGDIVQYVVLNVDTFESKIILTNKRSSSLNLTNFTWIDNDSIIFEGYSSKIGWGLIITDMVVDDGNVVSVKTRKLLDNAYLVDSVKKQKDAIVVAYKKKDEFAPFKVRTLEKNFTKQLKFRKRLNKKAPDGSRWLTDDYGNLIVTVGFDAKTKLKKAWYLKPGADEWALFWQGAEEVEFAPVSVSADGKSIYVISNEHDDHSSLYRYDPENQNYLERMYGNIGFDVTGAVLGPEKEILGVQFIQDGVVQIVYFDDALESFDKSLRDVMPGASPYLIDYSINQDTAIIRTSSSTDAGTYHLFRAAKRELTKFASVAPWLDGIELQQSRLITSESSDGLKIESYLTLPVPKAGVLPPLIVMPHGGPISIRDTRHYDADVQFLASQGYAVLRSNYRGSSGFGKTFELGGFGQWGRLIEADIESAVKVVVDRRVVNPERICIYGASYGGYSAMISAIHRPDLYKCAASFAGVMDLPLLFTDGSANSKRGEQFLLDALGDPNTQLDNMMAYSPVYRAKDLTVPVFIAQGGVDPIVDVEHFNRMIKMLNLYGKEYDNRFFPQEGHGFSKLSNKSTFYVELDEFFREQLGLSFLMEE